MSPQALVHSYLKRSLREDARIASLILRAWPDFRDEVCADGRPLRDRKVDEWLSNMASGEVSPDAVLALTETARVNGSRRLGRLEPWMRDRLAAELDRFAREIGA